MSSSLDCLDLCRLCLIKDRVSVPIFEDEGDVRQIFLKITACLPVKVSRDDKLPKKICDDCVYKVELFYQFWNTTANAEKQLLQWLGEVDLEDKQTYVTEVLDTNVMKQEQNSDNRLEGNVIQVSGHQNNMDIGMIEDMTIMTIPAGSEQQFTTVPMDTSGTVQTVQAVPGPSTHDQMGQSQTHLVTEEVEESEEEENSDDGCDNEEGLPVKEETEEVQTETFVNVPISCDEAGPSGLQQQKVTEMSEMSMTQTATDGDPKTGKMILTESATSAFTEKDISPQTDSVNDSSIPKKDNYLKVKSFATIQDDGDNNLIKEPSKDVSEEKTEIACQKKGSLTPLKNIDKKIVSIKINQNGTIRYLNVWPCKTCRKTYKDETSLNNHIKSVHPIVTKYYKCKNCDYLTPLMNNIKTHKCPNENNTDILKCDLCDLRVPEHILYIHRITHKPTIDPSNIKAPPTYKCDKCDLRFSTRNRLATHRPVHNMGSINKSDFNDYDYSTASNHDSEIRTYQNKRTKKCDLCNLIVSIKKYSSHLLSHRSTINSLKPIARPTYKCNICALRFESKKYLLIHRRKHGIDLVAKYECNICQQKFKFKHSLIIHIKSHEEFKCHVCLKKCTSKYSLNVHLRMHKRENRYYCDYCNRGFSSKAALQCHIVMHMNSGPFKCKVCHEFFTSQKSVYKHVETVHADKNSEYNCDLCKYSTQSRDYIIKHLGTHQSRINRSVACKVCGKVVTKKCLSQHMKKHGDRNYVCLKCGHKFHTKRNLDRHAVVHSEERPHKCKICGKGFKRTDQLRTHFKSCEKRKSLQELITS